MQVGCQPPGGNVGDSRLGASSAKQTFHAAKCGVPHATARRSATYHDTTVFKAQKTCVDTYWSTDCFASFAVKNLTKLLNLPFTQAKFAKFGIFCKNSFFYLYFSPPYCRIDVSGLIGCRPPKEQLRNTTKKKRGLL